MLGRISKVAAGVTVGLVAAAPMAWAGGTGYDDTDVKGANTDVKGKSKHDDDGKDKEKDKEKDKGKNKHHFSGKVCSFDGGDAGAESLISGGTLAAAVAQAPIAGGNIANIANCSDFLNNNLNGNLSGNNIAIGESLPI